MTAADRYRDEMGKEPPAAPDPETERQFSYRPSKDDPREYMTGRDPGDENDPVEPLPGQETLL